MLIVIVISILVLIGAGAGIYLLMLKKQNSQETSSVLPGQAETSQPPSPPSQFGPSSMVNDIAPGNQYAQGLGSVSPSPSMAVPPQPPVSQVASAAPISATPPTPSASAKPIIPPLGESPTNIVPPPPAASPEPQQPTASAAVLEPEVDMEPPVAQESSQEEHSDQPPELRI